MIQCPYPQGWIGDEHCGVFQNLVTIILTLCLIQYGSTDFKTENLIDRISTFQTLLVFSMTYYVIIENVFFAGHSSMPVVLAT